MQVLVPGSWFQSEEWRELVEGKEVSTVQIVGSKALYHVHVSNLQPDAAVHYGSL